MKATIADIRRGDRFIWAGRTHIAVDDARPGAAVSASLADFSLVAMLPGKTPVEADGYVHQRGRMVGGESILSTHSIEITERGIPVLLQFEEPDEPDVNDGITESGAASSLGRLDVIMNYRNAAHRQAQDADASRDEAVRRALRWNVPVSEIQGKTGLSRARIYQIRDNRR